MLLKPRFGNRMCNGIWPPSKPAMETPSRLFWPLTPRPPVLPLPAPMPRPTRILDLRAPALSRSSFSFMSCTRFRFCRAYPSPTSGEGRRPIRVVRERVGSKRFVRNDGDPNGPFRLSPLLPACAGCPLPRWERTGPYSATLTMCATFLIMPRTSGVSLRSTVRCILLSPRPISVARWSLVRRIGEPGCVILTVAIDLTPRSRPHPPRRFANHRGRAGRRSSCRAAAPPTSAKSGRRAQRHATGTEMPVAVVMQRTAFLERNANHRLLGSGGSRGDGFRHFARLAMPEADPALAVADDDERGEPEALAALHRLRNAIDVDQLLDQLFAAVVVAGAATTAIVPATAAVTAAAIAAAAARAATATAATRAALLRGTGVRRGRLRDRRVRRLVGFVSHSLELHSGFARGVGQRLDAAMVEEAATVEDALLDAGLR